MADALKYRKLLFSSLEMETSKLQSKIPIRYKYEKQLENYAWRLISSIVFEFKDSAKGH